MGQFIEVSVQDCCQHPGHLLFDHCSWCEYAAREAHVNRSLHGVAEWNGVPLSGGSTTGTGTLIESPSESMSGYGREDNDLGGGFNFDYSPVMSITSDERDYWRGKPEPYTRERVGLMEPATGVPARAWTSGKNCRGSQRIRTYQNIGAIGNDAE